VGTVVLASGRNSKSVPGIVEYNNMSMIIGNETCTGMDFIAYSGTATTTNGDSGGTVFIKSGSKYLFLGTLSGGGVLNGKSGYGYSSYTWPKSLFTIKP
jgi:hypothetical protein